MAEDAVPQRPRDAEFGDLTKGTIRRRTRALIAVTLSAIMRLLFGYHVKGLENIPETGPFILISNHIANADPILTQIGLKRNCHFFVKKEAFEVPLIGRFAAWTGGFPVDRGTADRWAIRRGLAVLEQGIGVGIYPEGTRSVNFGLQKGFSGAGMIALMSGAPIVPSVITGSERMPGNGKKGKITAGLKQPDPGHKGVLVEYGKPFIIPRELDGRRLRAEEATDMMMMVLARMLPPDYRGVYGERVTAEEAAQHVATGIS
jgi:1-acyl-sn-glycerol-3-phosphate acyltransferase